jgi:hypothetical protein
VIDLLLGAEDADRTSISGLHLAIDAQSARDAIAPDDVPVDSGERDGVGQLISQVDAGRTRESP